MNTFLDRVQTTQGEVIVITKVKFLFFFNRPRTSVMPMGTSDFGKRIGFQVRFNTSDEEILKQLHEFFVMMMSAGGFEPYLVGAKMGIIEFPSEYEHLKSHVIGLI